MPFLSYPKKTLLHGKSLCEYYVIFCADEIGVPFIDKQLSHCYAASWDGYNWAVINPCLGYTDVYVLQSVDPDIRVALADYPYTDIIHVSAWRKIKRWRAPFPVMFTCVEQIKALLGITAWRIITPKQLYKYLGENNGDTT